MKYLFMVCAIVNLAASIAYFFGYKEPSSFGAGLSSLAIVFFCIPLFLQERDK